MEAKTVHTATPPQYKQGQRGTYDGFRAVIVRHYSGSMWEIRLPGGVGCFDILHFIPEQA